MHIQTTLAPGANWPPFTFIRQPRSNEAAVLGILRRKSGELHPVKQYLQDHPGALASEICEATGLAMSTVSATLYGYCKSHSARSEIGVLRNSRNVRVKRYFLT